MQERLRAAELARVEERGRRRLTTVVAAGLLAVTTAGGLGLSSFLQQRQAGAARVALALKEASLLRDQAIEHPEDPARWPAALDGLARAEKAMAEAGGPEAGQQLAILGRQLRAGAEAAENDKVLLAKLMDIRSAKADDPDGSITDSAYAAAFRDAGYDIAGLDPNQIAARIKARPEPVRRALVANLDHWTGVRKARHSNGEDWPKLVAVARAADPDADRDALRAALSIDDKARRLAQIRPLTDRVKTGNWAPSSLVLLATTLDEAGDVEAGVRTLRHASIVHPGEVLIHHTLGTLLQKTSPPRTDQAIEAYVAARTLYPDLAHDLAHALEDHGRLEEAEAVFRHLVDRRPNQARHLLCLGAFLQHRHRNSEAGPFLDRAIAEYRKANEIDRESADGHERLGAALSRMGQLDEAIAESRKAIEIDPKSASAHTNLGVALFRKGQLDEAIPELRKAIEIEPKSANAHANLGNSLVKKGRLDEAIPEFRKAIELAPKYAFAHACLAPHTPEKVSSTRPSPSAARPSRLTRSPLMVISGWATP